MLFSLGYHLLKQYHLLDDYNHGYLFSKGVGIIAALSSFFGIMVCQKFLSILIIYFADSFLDVYNFYILVSKQTRMQRNSSLHFIHPSNECVYIFTFNMCYFVLDCVIHCAS